MEETVGPTRKSSRTPVPKKSFDLVEEYDVRPSAHNSKSTPDGTPSREQKKLSKGPALIKIGRKKTAKSKKESPVKEKRDQEPEPEPIPTIKITPKEKISSKKRKYSAVENEDSEKSTSKKSSEVAVPLSPLKITLSTVPSQVPVIKNPETDLINTPSKTLTRSPSKRRKTKNSKEDVTVEDNHISISESKVVDQKTCTFDAEKSHPAKIDSDDIATTPDKIEEVRNKKANRNEQKQNVNRTSTESDAFINSFNLAPEKKSKKKATKPSKQPLKHAESTPDEEVISPINETKLSNEQTIEKPAVTEDHVFISTAENEDIEMTVSKQLAENVAKKVEVTPKKNDKNPSPQKKQIKTEIPPSSSQELNNETNIESAVKIKVEEVNLEEKPVEESIEVAVNDVEALTGLKIPEGAETTHLKMKKRKVYKRKHGERILVRIVTELYDESGKVINSTVEEVKNKNEQSKKLNPSKSKPKLKSVEKKNNGRKKLKKSNGDSKHNDDGTVGIPADEGHQSIAEDLPSPSKKRSEGGGKEFKKMQTLTAYILYCRKHRKRVVQQHPSYDFAQISKKLGEMWNNTSDPEKEVYRLQLEVHKAKVHSALRKIKLKSTGFSDENDGSLDDDLPSSLRLMKKRDAKEQVDIPIYSTTNLEPIDFASHMVLLGESLTMISSALFQQDQQTVHGSLSVLLDSCLCALAPLLFLTSSVPEIDSLPDEMMANTLDNISYILPGV